MADGSMSSLSWLYGASALASIFGSVQSGRSARAVGQYQKMVQDFNARQAEEDAIAAIAVGQRQGFEEQRQADLVASRALAVSAASGNASDPGIVKILSNIKGEGAYRAGVALYEGEARARAFRVSAAGARMSGENAMLEGRNKQSAYNIEGASKAANASYKYNSLFGKYGSKKPNTEFDYETV